MRGSNPFEEARDLLYAQLAKSPDESVRVLNELTTRALPDNDPRVARIAAAIVERRNAALNDKTKRHPNDHD